MALNSEAKLKARFDFTEDPIQLEVLLLFLFLCTIFLMLCFILVHFHEDRYCYVLDT